MTCSPDEERIAAALEVWATGLEARANRDPFALNRTKAEALRRAAANIRVGLHRVRPPD